MNATADTTTTTVNNEAEALPTTPTITPPDELLRLQPPLTSVWVPVQFRDTTEAEDVALERFIRHLPVSPQLDHHGLVFLTSFIAPFFEGRDGVVVTPQQIVGAWDRHFAKRHNTTTVPKVLASLRVIFGAEKVLVIGQLEIEHDATTGQLTVRRNAENYSRLLEFLVQLDGEALA